MLPRSIALLLMSLCLSARTHAAPPPEVADAVSARVVADPGLAPKLADMDIQQRRFAVAVAQAHFRETLAQVSCSADSCMGGWAGVYLPVAASVEPPLPDDLKWWLGFNDYILSGSYAAAAGVATPPGCYYVRTLVVLRTARQDEDHSPDDWIARTSDISGLVCAGGSFQDVPVPAPLTKPDAYFSDRFGEILKTVPGP